MQFLAPYREGPGGAPVRGWRLAPGGRLARRLLQVQEHAGAWQTEHAVPELAEATVGQGRTADDPGLVQGKALFDAYRAEYAGLLAQLRRHNDQLMATRALLDRSASTLEVLLAGCALGLGARRPGGWPTTWSGRCGR